MPGGGETKADVSAWTVDSLHQHLTGMIEAQDRRLREVIDERDRLYTERLETFRNEFRDHAITGFRTYETGLAAVTKATETALRASEIAALAAFEASQAAIAKSEAATEKRFAAVNEFREQLADQAATFMPRTEAIAADDRNAERTGEMAHRIGKSISREDAVQLIERTVDRLDDLTSRLDRSEGHGKGMATGWGYLLGAIAAFSTLVALVMLVVNRGG